MGTAGDTGRKTSETPGDKSWGGLRTVEEKRIIGDIWGVLGPLGDGGWEGLGTAGDKKTLGDV